jgi:chromosome segregation ATPase
LDERENMEKEHSIIKQQLEEDAENEINTLKTNNANDLQHVSEASLKSKGELSLTRKKFKSQTDEIDELQEKLKDIEIDLKNQSNRIYELKKQINENKTKIGELDKTIGDKEKKI